MIGFTESTIPAISASVDFFNVMTYDLMNRRDNVTKHHTGIELSTAAVSAYLSIGVPIEKINLGFGFFIKWFTTDPNGGCETRPVGCKTVLMQDPVTGRDLGTAGAFTWHEGSPDHLQDSFDRAMNDGGQFDLDGHYFWDRTDQIFWSWDAADSIMEKFPAIVEKESLNGVFAWGLGEDADDFVHLQALNAGVERYTEKRRKDSDIAQGRNESSDANAQLFLAGGESRGFFPVLCVALGLALFSALLVH